MSPWVLATLCVSAVLSGCYQSHPLLYVGGPDAGRDGGQGDAAPADVGPPPPLDGGPPPDVGPPPFDAGRDAGRDAGFDAGRDAGFDAGRDAGFDAGRDAGRDGGRDAGRDAGRDSGVLDAGPPPFDAGPRRPALRLSRTTFWGVGDAPTFDLPDRSTFEIWVRSRELRDAEICRKGDAMARDLVVGQRDGALVAGWQVAGVPYFLSGGPMPFDTWVHVAIVRRRSASGASTDAELYVDGALVATGTLPRLVDSFNDLPFRCGFADADVDEVRLWRITRTGSDILANMRRRVSGGIPGMQSYWRLDESGQILIDYTAMGRVGILGHLTTPDPADPVWIADGPF